MRFAFKRPSAALVVSIVALVAALGGTSYAAFSLPKNSVGTKQLKKNAITTPKIKNRAVTASKINTSGLTVPNATNAANAANATNASNASTLGGSAPSAFEKASSILTAVVTNNGTTATVVRGSPGVTASKVAGPGVVYVHMGRDVTNCTWIATQGNPGGDPVPAAFATVRGDVNNTSTVPPGSPNDVEVVTFDPTTGAQVAANFHLLVIC
jgi:hypothetical protein